MKLRDTPAIQDLLVTGMPVIAGMVDVWIRYQYHWAANETVTFAKLLGAIVLLPFLVMAAHAAVGSTRRLGRAFGTALLVFARVLALWLFAMAAFPSSEPVMVRWQHLPELGRGALLLGLGVIVVMVQGEGVWRRLRLAVAVAAMLFVCSGPLLAWARAEDRFWPDRQAVSSTLETSEAVPAATVLLLLDETSANAARPLTQVLKEAGWDVDFHSVAAVADGTAKAVPQMFTGEDFRSAKPCAFTAICSNDHVLDFKRVHASRSDIDVVGFFHPYCAMQGLRFCHGAGVSMPLLDGNRWACAVDRARHGTMSPECEQARDAAWMRQKRELLDAVWAAPLWTHGGILFAHLPLPHPPATAPSRRLSDDYRDNLREAAELLDKVARRLAARGAPATLIVFSDHPLRPAMWCADVRYAAADCITSAAPFHDDRVPLIVATWRREAPRVDRVRDNAGVFDLLQGAAARPAAPQGR